MAYNEKLAARIRRYLLLCWGPFQPASSREWSSLTNRLELDHFRLEERTLFGGLAFLVNGNIALGILKDDLFVHTGPQEEGAPDLHAVKLCDPLGQPLEGWLLIPQAGYHPDGILHPWFDSALRYIQSLNH